ncbi:hypothetical protein [Mycolicibacterium thermoresistibile]
MTEPEDSNRPISVAELLARNGTIGAPPVGGRRRRRRGNADAITVAELTGEIPVVGDDTEPEDAQKDGSGPDGSGRAAPVETPAERTDEQELPGPTGRTDLPKRETLTPAPDRDRTGQDRSAHRAPRRPAVADSDPDEMVPDPLDDGEDAFESPVDLADAPEIDYGPADFDDDADGPQERVEVAERRPWSRSTHDELFGGPTVADRDTPFDLDTDDVDDTDLEGDLGAEFDETDDETDLDEDLDENLDEEVVEDDTADVGAGEGSRLSAILRGALVVGQCLLAVAFGAGLFLGFDQLWRWNSIVTLVLSMLVILGLVAGVRVVRKTEDITSTMIAVVVGALVTFGPLALQLQAS